MVKPLFIYFRHTPRGVRFIVSYDATPVGETKTLMLRSDPNARLVVHAINCIKLAIKSEGGFNPARRPDFAAITKLITQGRISESFCQAAGMMAPEYVRVFSNDVYSEMVHIPSDSHMGERIMFKPKVG